MGDPDGNRVSMQADPELSTYQHPVPSGPVDAAIELVFQFKKIFKVKAVVVIGNEHRIPIMPTVNDVVGTVGNDDATSARHAFLLHTDHSLAINKSVPVFLRLVILI